MGGFGKGKENKGSFQAGETLKAKVIRISAYGYKKILGSVYQVGLSPSLPWDSLPPAIQQPSQRLPVHPSSAFPSHVLQRTHNPPHSRYGATLVPGLSLDAALVHPSFTLQSVLPILQH